MWKWHFGTGIVDTPSNFGRLGERPTHPELLEHLAGHFLANRRSIKELHREIMRSSVYQLAAVHSDDSYKKDPENRLYWRANARRLDAETIRDSLLFVAGTLDEEVGGKSLELTDPENNRRTLYGNVSRFSLDRYLQTFDVPSPSIAAEKRFTTNVPLQSLFFMNSEFVYRQARYLVHRLSSGGEEVATEPAARDDAEVKFPDTDLDRIPDEHQGNYISSKVPKKETEFDPETLIAHIKNERFELREQRRELDLIGKLNRRHLARQGQADPQLEGAIRSMETAYRMQTEAPEVFDIRKESDATLELYGPGHTARGCLMAARLIESGVRIVQLYYSKGSPWDAHLEIFGHRRHARNVDRPFAALIKDLKSRGLFDETLVVCGTEFGRTPVLQSGGGAAGGRVTNGRDHNPFGFTIWLAGGGVKGGMVYGATDDFGFKAVENPVHVHDLHATILYLLGIDHEKLTYRYSGRDFRLTDVHGKVIHDIIA